MSERRVFIDHGPGETRGVVTVNGRPERLWIERAGEARARVGDRYAARVTQVDRIGGLAFLDLGGEPAALRLKAERAPPPQGALLEVEVTAEGQRGKSAVVRSDALAEGEPRLLRGGGDLAKRLATLYRAKADEGPEARDAADEAEAEALAIEHPLPGGGSIAIEPTRALVSVDVDLGGRAGVAGETKKAARQTNMLAIAETARLLRLKALGGLVVIDLIGRSHDGVAVANAARIAFAGDMPGVIIGPITKFGMLELSLPQRERPIAEVLLDGQGRLTPQSAALRMLRALEREGRADPGARLLVRCAPEVAEAAQVAAGRLAERLGKRFAIEAQQGLCRADFTVGRA